MAAKRTTKSRTTASSKSAEETPKKPGRSPRKSQPKFDPTELLELVQRSLDQHVEHENYHQNVAAAQDELTSKVDQLSNKVDQLLAFDFEKLMTHLDEARTEVQTKVGGLQAALELCHQKQFEHEKQKEALEDRANVAETKFADLEQQYQELEKRFGANQRELSVVQGSRTNLSEEREQLYRDIESLQEQLQKALKGNAPKQPDKQDDQPAPRRAAPVEKPLNAKDAFWESQKSELFKKYGFQAESNDLVENETSATNDESASQTVEVDLLSEAKVAQPEEERQLEVEDEPNRDGEVKTSNLSPIDGESEIKSVNLSPIMPVVEPENTGEVDAQARRREVELSLERARISRKRKALEDKIIALKTEMTSERENGNGILSRMKKFLGKNGKRSKEIAEMKNMIDQINGPAEEPPQEYFDPRDQPFFKNLSEAPETDGEPAELLSEEIENPSNNEADAEHDALKSPDLENEGEPGKVCDAEKQPSGCSPENLNVGGEVNESPKKVKWKSRSQQRRDETSQNGEPEVKTDSDNKESSSTELGRKSAPGSVETTDESTQKSQPQARSAKSKAKRKRGRRGKRR